jgi:hypothetical protein
MILPTEHLRDTFVVYAIRHSFDLTMEYRYVGMTNNLKSRANKHLRDARSGKNRYVCQWIQRHLGFVSFDVLEVCPNKESLALAEIKWIHILRSRGYRLANHTEGGEGAFGRKASDETRSQISSSLKKSWETRLLTAEDRKIIGEKSKGRAKVWSTEARAKAALASTGRIATPETRAKISSALTGRHNPNVAKGNHTRYHTNRGITKESCRFCTS